MNTIITLTKNGNVAPDTTIDLGYKYENVGDTLTFNIPEEYKPYHHYLVFCRKKLKPIVLPINNLVFKITVTITKNPGIYDMTFVATENQVFDDNIEAARKVFVSNTMTGQVKDSCLNNPVTEDKLDDNLQIIFDDLLDLKKTLETNIDTGVYIGDYYYPTVSVDGKISWEVIKGNVDKTLPTPTNIRGPVGHAGDYFFPTNTLPGVIVWERKPSTLTDIPTVTDFNPAIVEATNNYLNVNLKPLVNAGIDNKFKWVWDSKEKILYITAEEGHEVTL